MKVKTNHCCLLLVVSMPQQGEKEGIKTMARNKLEREREATLCKNSFFRIESTRKLEREREKMERKKEMEKEEERKK